MGKRKKVVYCAGPLFTNKEKEEMLEIATSLEERGFSTFLPQRDGLELAKCSKMLTERGMNQRSATNLLSRAIFALDVYQVVVACDGIAVNLNGRVPDEGAVSEAALAWCANKIVVGYKADDRSVFMGEDNPLVLGLFGFNICNSIPGIVDALMTAFEHHPIAQRVAEQRGRQIKQHLELGSQIWNALRAPNGVENVAQMLCRSLPTENHLRESASPGKALNELVAVSLGK